MLTFFSMESRKRSFEKNTVAHRALARHNVPPMDPVVHKRYLDYRDRFAYFGKKRVMLTMAEFADADTEYRTLAGKGDDRDDDEEARFALLTSLLLRD